MRVPTNWCAFQFGKLRKDSSAGIAAKFAVVLSHVGVIVAVLAISVGSVTHYEREQLWGILEPSQGENLEASFSFVVLAQQDNEKLAGQTQKIMPFWQAHDGLFDFATGRKKLSERFLDIFVLDKPLEQYPTRWNHSGGADLRQGRRAP